MRYFRNGGPEAATGLRGLVLPGVGYGMRACLCAAVLGGLGCAVRARGVWGVAITMGDRVLASRHVILPSRLVSLRVGAHVQIFSISVKEELDTDEK